MRLNSSCNTHFHDLPIRLPAENEILLERAAATLHVSKSEFIRRSIVAAR